MPGTVWFIWGGGGRKGGQTSQLRKKLLKKNYIRMILMVCNCTLFIIFYLLNERIIHFFSCSSPKFYSEE